VPETDPRIRHGSRYTTHEKRPDRSPLARIEQREHDESGANILRPINETNGSAGDVGTGTGMPSVPLKACGVDNAVNTAAKGGDLYRKWRSVNRGAPLYQT
jgi:hypothetical protein